MSTFSQTDETTLMNNNKKKYMYLSNRYPWAKLQIGNTRKNREKNQVIQWIFLLLTIKTFSVIRHWLNNWIHSVFFVGSKWRENIFIRIQIKIIPSTSNATEFFIKRSIDSLFAKIFFKTWLLFIVQISIKKKIIE